MKFAYFSVCAAALAAALSGCASTADDIKAASVNPAQFSYMTCDQLTDYGQKLNATYKLAADQQSDARAEDAVGYMLLQQPLGSQRHSQVPAEIADLKGRLIAVQQVESEKSCSGRSQTVAN